MNFGIASLLVACCAIWAPVPVALAEEASAQSTGPARSSAFESTSRDSASADSLRTYTLAPITITGSRLGADRLAPFGATLRRREDRDIPAAGGITSLLEASPGIDLRRQGGPGAPVWLSIRGSNTDQVLVLVDGVPVNASRGGGADLALLPGDGIGAAEILRGPAAALWGAGALAGMVQLITLPQAASGASVSLECGSFDTEAIAASIDHVSGRTNVALRAARARSDGDFRYGDRREPEPLVRKNAGFGRDHLDLHVRREESGRLWESAFSILSARRGMPGTIEFPTEEAEQSDRQMRALVAIRPARDAAWPGQAGLEMTFLDQRRRYSDPASGWGPVSESHESRRFESRLLWSAMRGGMACDAGLAPSWETLESTTDGERSRRALTALVRLQQAIARRANGEARARAAATVRADATSSFAPSLDPALGFSFEIVPGRAEISLAAARTHRLPSFDDLFWPASAFVAGNPDLRAENASAVDAGIRVHIQGADLSAGVFRSDVTDLIQWSPSAGGRWRPHNVGRALLRGIEGEIAAARGVGRGWRASATVSGTLLDALDRSAGRAGENLPRRPRLGGGAAFGLERGAWSARVLFDGVSLRYLNDADTKSLPAHMTADVSLQAPLAPGFSAQFDVRNVTGEAYVDVADYPVPGREWSLRVRYTHRHGGNE